MDIAGISSTAARFSELPPQRNFDQAAPNASTPEASAPQQASAVRQSAESAELGDRPEQRRPGELTEQEQAVVRDLKARDREVRAHEQAHKAAAGPYGGAISYEYQRGPDGQNYAVGGSVPIDVSPEDSPEDTVDKMRIVIKAALAPAEPSAQDRAVAALAQSQLAQAQAELTAQRAEERRGEQEEGGRSRAAAEAYQSANDDDITPILSLIA